MSNILEFVLDIKNLMNPKMAQASSYVQGQMGNIASAASGMSSSVARSSNSAANSVSVVGSSASAATIKVNNLGNALERLHARRSGGGSGLGGYVGVGALVGGASYGLMEMVKEGAQQQRDITGLTTFLGASQAKSFYAELQKESMGTPFVTRDLLGANRMLISSGMNWKDANKDVMNLANAVAATGGNNFVLERMAMHLQTIKSNGYAGAMQLKEFGTNGINIYRLLSDYTGKTVKKTEGLKVSYQQLSGALDYAAKKGGLFYGALEAQSKTIIGKWSTFVDQLQVAAGTIVMGQSDGITGMIDELIRLTERLPELAKEWGPAISNITGKIISLVGTLIDMAKWVYHNWALVEFIGGAFIIFKIAVEGLYAAAAMYNGVMAIAAFRTAWFAKQEAVAVVTTNATTAAVGRTTAAWGGYTTYTYGAAAATATATEAVEVLDIAMAATPWGAIALGITAVVAALLALNSAGKSVKEIEIGNKIADANEDYNKITQHARYDLQNDAVQKFDNKTFLDRNSTDFYGTEFQNVLEARLGNPSLKKTLGSHIKDIYKDAISNPNTVELITTKHNANDFSVGHSSSVSKILSFFDEEYTKFSSPDKKTNKELHDKVSEVGDSIVGGGQRVIHIHQNAPMIKEQIFNVKSMAEAKEMSISEFSELLLREMQAVAEGL